MGQTITEDTYEKVLNTGVAAGQATTLVTALDVKDGSQILIRTLIGTIVSTGTVTITPQYSTDGTNYTDITAQAITFTDADDNKLAIHEFCNLPPTVKKVRVKIVTATANGTITCVLAQVKNSRKVLPVGATGASALDSTVLAVKRFPISV